MVHIQGVTAHMRCPSEEIVGSDIKLLGSLNGGLSYFSIPVKVIVDWAIITLQICLFCFANARLYFFLGINKNACDHLIVLIFISQDLLGKNQKMVRTTSFLVHNA